MNNKTISDLSSISLNDLNVSCNFVLDDANKKTKKVSLQNLEQKLSSDLNIQNVISVNVKQVLSSGVHIASISVDNIETEIYAPEQKLSSETWTFVLEDGITEVTKNVCLSIG